MKILFIKLGAIGDVVQAAAAVKEFRRRNPNAQVDWVAGSGVKALIEMLGVADSVIGVEDAQFLVGSFYRRLVAFAQSIWLLANRGQYDMVVTAHSDYRYRLLSLGVRARTRVGFTPRSFRPIPISDRNRVQEYWRLLTGGDAEAIDIPQMMLSLGKCLDNCPAAGVIPKLPARYIVLAAGGAKNLLRDDALRRWPIEMYRALADRLILDGRQVVLVGGEGDRWVSKSFSGLPVIDLIGKTTIGALLKITGGATVVVTNDSGILHLAAITRTAIVALFGPTPANAVIPYGREKTIVLEERNRVSCSPCYDGRNYAPCARPICLESIPVQRVLDSVKRFISV